MVMYFSLLSISHYLLLFLKLYIKYVLYKIKVIRKLLLILYFYYSDLDSRYFVSTTWTRFSDTENNNSCVFIIAYFFIFDTVTKMDYSIVISHICSTKCLRHRQILDCWPNLLMVSIFVNKNVRRDWIIQKYSTSSYVLCYVVFRI